MAKFSLARQPYYVAVIFFMLCSAFECYIGNTTSMGVMSDVFLGMLVISLALAGLAAVYLNILKVGGNDEADAEVAGLPVGKSVFYVGILLMCAWRAITGYQWNHNFTGIASTYGMLWLLASIALAAFTFANYRSFAATRATTPRGPTAI